ncbi:DUF1810 domain-containing protein [Flavobacterium hydrophilum]|uniref:DUF1810 domain-containing protein n=1 Tax=Flavobacterium hydrophilum TaxID=2211445 RepID=A0A2V4C642_9FLAO|nr:DUF1810 domain-containing protein [Flavobacterium hydrophilum]PXY46457.1 DUF1810 domain-containing protein [Flavobacterium hydrophilum]
MIYSNTDLTRFLDAQNKLYLNAYSEINKGKKQSHWMWFIFPQIKGLGKSSIADYYAIANLEEAAAFLNHPVLAKNFIEISQLLLTLKRKSAESIFGELDAMKLRSSLTLFSQVENANPIFQELLDIFFGGRPDPLTMSIIKPVVPMKLPTSSTLQIVA